MLQQCKVKGWQRLISCEWVDLPMEGSVTIEASLAQLYMDTQALVQSWSKCGKKS